MKDYRIQIFKIMIFMKHLQRRLNLLHHKYFVQYIYLIISKISTKVIQIIHIIYKKFKKYQWVFKFIFI